jgi:hypothetical protein
MTHCISSLASRQLTKVSSTIYIHFSFLIYYSRCSSLGPSVRISASRYGPLTMARKTKSMTKGYKGGQSSGTSSSRHSDQPKRPPLTHFLCIPLVTETSNPQLEASLRQFKESVSTVPADETPPSFGTPPKLPLFSPKAVRPIGTIHFTLGVMSLETEERVDKAINYLKSVDFRSLGVGFAGEEHVTGQGRPLASLVNLPFMISYRREKEQSP